MIQIPKLFQVYPSKNYSVHLYYDNGEIKIYDCKWILKEGGLFKKLHNPDIFVQLCTVMNGTLAWDIFGCRDPYNCIDICPDTIYKDSVKSSEDPLKVSA